MIPTYLLLAEAVAVIGLVLAIVAFIVSITLAIIASQRPDEGGVGFVFAPDTNQASPEDPVPIGVGNGWDEPPIIAWYTEAQRVNSREASQDEALIVIVENGSGPQDGRNLSIEIDDLPYQIIVDKDSPILEQRLTFVDTNRTLAFFPKMFVERESITLFWNGDPFAQLGRTAVSDDDIEQTHREFKNIKPLLYSLDRFSFARSSFVVPDPGPYFFIKVRAKTSRVYANGNRIDLGWQDLVKDVHFRVIQDFRGDTRVLVNSAVEKGFPTLGFASFLPKLGSGIRVTEFEVEYDLTINPELGEIPLTFKQDPDGSSSLKFTNSIPGTVEITASYRSLPIGAELGVEARFGERDQAPLSLPAGSPKTVVHQQPLVQGIAKRVRTQEAVHNLRLIIEGPQGFAHIGADGDVENLRVGIRIRIRSTSAPDLYPWKNQDFLAGWVSLYHEGLEEITLKGRFDSGGAIWEWDVAEMYKATLEALREATVIVLPQHLPLDSYEVEIVRTTDDSSNPRYLDKLFWKQTTEWVHVLFALPHRSPMKLRFPKQDAITSRPKIRIRFNRLILSEYDNAGVKLRERWSRNTIWACVTIFLNKDWGLGAFGYDETNVNWPNIVTAAAKSFSKDADGFAWSEVDFVEHRSQEVWSMLTRLCLGSGFGPIFVAGQLYFVVEAVDGADETAIEFFTGRDLYKGRAIVQVPRIEESPNAFKAIYPAEDPGFSPLYIPPEGGAKVVRELETNFHAVRRPHQAERELLRLRRQTIEQFDTFKFLFINRRSMRLVPGDVFQYDDDDHQLHGKFRVASTRKGSNHRTEILASLIKKGASNNPPKVRLSGAPLAIPRQTDFRVASPLKPSPIGITKVETLTNA